VHVIGIIRKSLNKEAIIRGALKLQGKGICPTLFDN
jgi:hypothetical protein